MNRQRHVELERNTELKLTEEEISEGWFFCCDWDGMLINRESHEAACCSCRANGVTK